MQQGDGGIKPTREGPNVKAIVAIALVVLVAIFAFQNAESADVGFLFWEAQLPVWIVIGGTAAAGFIAGFLVGRSSGRRSAIRKLSD